MHTANEHSENIESGAGQGVTDVLLAAADHAEPGRADTLAVRGLFRELGFPAERILSLSGSQTTAAGIFRVLSTLSSRGVDLGPASRLWFFYAGPGVQDTVAEISRAMSGTGCARRLLLLDFWLSEGDRPGEGDWPREGDSGFTSGAEAGSCDDRIGPVVIAAVQRFGQPGFGRGKPGALTAALLRHLGGADVPVTAGDLVARLAGVARAHLPPAVSPMLLFPHLLGPSDLHRLRRRGASASPQEAAAIWRELVLLDPQDSDARVLQAHFESLAHSTKSAS